MRGIKVRVVRGVECGVDDVLEPLPLLPLPLPPLPPPPPPLRRMRDRFDKDVESMRHS